MRELRAALALSVALLAACGGALAFQIPEESRLDRLAIADPSLVTPPASLDVETLAKGSRVQLSWERFVTEKSGSWRVVLDGRSGAPLLVEGSGIRWPVRATADALPALETSLRAFFAENRDLLLADGAELVLDREASGLLAPETMQVVFTRAVAGVPVRGDRYVFTLGQDRLVAFGAARWTQIDVDLTPDLTPELAVETLGAYAGIPTRDGARLLAAPQLQLVPLPGQGGADAAYGSALVWQVVLSFAGERGTWVGLVDAHDGTVRGFFDDDRYAQVKGGIQPESGDGQCPSGCQQPNYPMPFARVTVNGGTVVSSAMGQFTCSPAGATATTALTSQTVSISDSCGQVSETVTCDANIDLGTSTGSNCSVAPGSSAGNTKASRSCFYMVNRLKEHARAWFLNNNNWVNNVQTTVNSNVNSTCNATWGGSSLNMYRAGGGCNNTCEAIGVASHEWGHGMDQNDGGGFDNSSEAYGDISEFLTDHTSCIGRGFFVSGRCGGYGDACLTCSGIRDMDWAARIGNTPATPAGFVTARCPGGGGPCGREEHCEAYVAGESMWDLAARDLPASGLDQATAWQVADRLWYRSRQGSGGNMYTCTLPNSNGCSATSLFSRLRAADDDDNNLGNGTPHAAAIFAAFNRHGIACGLVSDGSNQSTTVCPALVAPTVTGEGVQNEVQLSWAAVPGATSYRILRNDIRCDYSYTVVATVAAPGTSYLDSGLANDFPLYYRVQALGTNTQCESPVSACTAVTPHIIGPYGVSGAQQQVLDACTSGGAGGDGTWDAGETVRLTFPVSNIGSTPITNLTASISTTAAGIEILDGTAIYPDIPVAGSAGALAPYFTLRLSPGVACGTLLPFDVQMTGTGGTWGGFFTQRVGGTATAGSTPLNETFSGGIPASWTVVNSGSGGGPASTWTTANPGGRTFTPPLTDPVAIVDSNIAGSSNSQDEQLITPAMNLSGSNVVTLQFDHYFRDLEGHNAERGDVDVRSSVTGNQWVNVLRFTSDTPNPEHRSVNISTQAAGATNAQVRFRYYLGSSEWWWMVDNVRVDMSGPVCTMTACAASPQPKPVVGMEASRADAEGTTLDVTWDSVTCISPDHEILYGNLADVASTTVTGSVCGLGGSGATTWSGVPAGDLWFVVVGSDGAGTEGSWGTGFGGAPLQGGDASGQCGNVFRYNGGTCP